MILVLEDEDFRRRFFAEKLAVTADCIFLDPGALVERVQSLKDRGVDPEDVTIFLDHDLGLKVQDPYPREITGYDAAKALAEIGWPCRYVIHSINPVGSQRMVQALAALRVERIPFFTLAERAGWIIPTEMFG